MFYLLPIPRITPLALRIPNQSAPPPVSKHHRTPFQSNYSLYQQPTVYRRMAATTDSQCTDSVTLRGVSAAVVVVERSKFYILLVCVCSLRYQHELRMHHILIWGLPGYTVLPKLSHKRHYFGNKVTEQNNACFDFL